MKKNISLILIMIMFFQLIIYKKTIYANEFKNADEEGIYNVLLIGVDGFKEGKSRADSMMILTIDNKNKSLKLSSIARDTLVRIPGRGYDKLNHAFSFGREDLLLKTINENLSLNIKDYAIIDFNGFIDLVNLLEGVEVNIEDREINGLNKVINACYGLNIENKGNNKIEYVNSGGNQILNGYQALAYCRLRKIDDCFYRDERQRKVLKSLVNKLSKVSVIKYPQLIETILKYVKVNIPADKILKLAFLSKDLSSYEMKQLQFPNYKYRNDGMLNSKYVIEWQEEENLRILHNFIYNN